MSTLSVLVEPKECQTHNNGTLRANVRIAAGLAVTLTYFITRWAILMSTLPVALVIYRTMLIRIIKTYPFTSLFAAYIALFVSSSKWQASVDTLDLLVYGGLSWLSVGVLTVPTNVAFANSRNMRLPARLENWVQIRLKNPADIFYVRLMANNSIIIAPAMLEILIPSSLSVFTTIGYLYVSVRMSMPQESLIHSDVHNHFFRYKHLRRWWERLVFQILNGYLKCVIPFISCRVPLHYSVTHAMIHHVENNGVKDIQTTVLYDRRSFMDFCAASWASGMYTVFCVEYYRYLAKRKMIKPIRTMAMGQLVWFGALALVACFNLYAAAILFFVPFIAGPARVVGNFLWHGLVDIKDPDNVYTNTVNIAAGPDAIQAWHVEHHVRPSDHWSKQRMSAENDNINYERECTVVYRAHPDVGHLFLLAMWTRRFDLLASICIPTCGAQRNPEIFARILEERTRPLIPLYHGPIFMRVDELLGRMVARYLLLSTFPNATQMRQSSSNDRGTQYIAG